MLGWSYLPSAGLLNSGFFTSFTTAASRQEEEEQGDLVAIRMYAERATHAGVTPPTLSLAYYTNASSYGFTWSPIGFVEGNTHGGAFDTLITVSLSSVFEWEDKRGDATYNEKDKVLSEVDLSTLVWDTACSSITVNDTDKPSSDFHTIDLASLVVNRAFSNLTVRLQLQFGTNEYNSNGWALNTTTSQALMVGPRNAVLTVTIDGYDFKDTKSILALNMTVLTVRGANGTSILEPHFVDLTGDSGKSDSKLPPPTVNATTNTTDMHYEMRNVVVNGKDDAQVYVAWNNAPMIVDAASGNATTIRVAATSPKDGSLSDASAASRMFLTNVPDPTSLGNAISRSVVLSFSPPGLRTVTLALSIGCGPVPLPGTEPGTDHTIAYILVAIGAAAALALAAACICYSKRVKVPPSMSPAHHQQPAAKPAGIAAAAAGSGYGALDSPSASGGGLNEHLIPRHAQGDAPIHVASPGIPDQAPASYSPTNPDGYARMPTEDL